MSNRKRPSPSFSLIAYLFRDAQQKLQIVHLSPQFRVDGTESGTFVLTPRSFNLPDNFFGTTVSSITALVGKNSSGKSTVLSDIARIFSNIETVTSGYTLIVQHRGSFLLLRYNLDIRVLFQGEEISPVADDFHFDKNELKIVYFSSGFDPMRRKLEFMHAHPSVGFADISSQYFYNHPGRPHGDFPEKLAYLQGLVADRLPLELTEEGDRTRAISFEAALPYMRERSGSELVSMWVQHLHQSSDGFIALRDALRAKLNLDDSHFTRELAKLRQGTSTESDAFWTHGVDYFDLLLDFLKTRAGWEAIASDSVVLLLVIGRVLARYNEAYQRNQHADIIEDIRLLLDNPDQIISHLLGEDFIRHAGIFGRHARTKSRYAKIVVSIDSKLSGSAQELVASFLALWNLGVVFNVEFNGLSDGQRSLLSFAARYAAEAKQKPCPGCTLLLIDEHEQGLHPEWQRKFIKHLCALIGASSGSAGQTQVILSSHSPFVVSDLPDMCVNVIGGQSLSAERTFGSNLLELLLSPLFMEQTTGEFAVEKIKGWLKRIKRLRDPGKLKALEPLIELVGDTLLRNYLHLALNERLAELDQDAETS